MGMAASQGRLLMMTARLSNNEFEQQSVAYSKQRLADDSLDANDKYMDAMNSTKYQLLTGYNGNSALYEDVTYNQLTGYNNVATGKQYIVSDVQGRVLVSKQIAEAFTNGNGDYNKFLAALNLTQAVIDTDDEDSSLQAIHEAWDKYLVAVEDGLNNNPEIKHIISFNYKAFTSDFFDGYPTYEVGTFKNIGNAENSDNADNTDHPVCRGSKNGVPYYYLERYKLEVGEDEEGNLSAFYTDADGQVTVLSNVTVSEYAGHNGEYKFVYKNEEGQELESTSDLTNLYVNRDNQKDSEPMIYTSPEEIIKGVDDGTYESPEGNIYKIEYETKPIYYCGATNEQRDLYDYAVSLTEAYYNKDADHSALSNDSGKLGFYRNIYDQMTSKGFTTYEEMIKEGYMKATEGDENKAYIDDKWLITQLKKGKLTISYYSAVEKKFVATTLDDDESIVEREDKAKIALAEQEYQRSMDRIEKEDKIFDLQLNKLESEHTALQTEYESVAKVISKNVEKSFNTFNA